MGLGRKLDEMRNIEKSISDLMICALRSVSVMAFIRLFEIDSAISFATKEGTREDCKSLDSGLKSIVRTPNLMMSGCDMAHAFD